MTHDEAHHNWDWKYQDFEGRRYVCVEYIERCAAEQGLDLIVRSRDMPDALRWLDVDGTEWLYVAEKAALELVADKLRKWESLRDVLAHTEALEREARLRELETHLAMLCNTSEAVLTRIGVHNATIRGSAARLQDIQGPVIDAFSAATHNARQALKGATHDE